MHVHKPCGSLSQVGQGHSLESGESNYGGKHFKHAPGPSTNILMGNIDKSDSTFDPSQLSACSHGVQYSLKLEDHSLYCSTGVLFGPNLPLSWCMDTTIYLWLV